MRMCTDKPQLVQAFCPEQVITKMVITNQVRERKKIRLQSRTNLAYLIKKNPTKKQLFFYKLKLKNNMYEKLQQVCFIFAG